MPREILIANRHPHLRLNRRAVTKVIHTLDADFFPATPARSSGSGQSKLETRKSKIPEGELSLVFLTDAALAQLHAEFLGDPAPTDVITFAGDPGAGTAGEICVSVDAALRHSGRRDISAELTLYLVHGWLHLAGHDDLVPAKKRRMRRAEARALRLLRIAGNLPHFTLRR